MKTLRKRLTVTLLLTLLLTWAAVFMCQQHAMTEARTGIRDQDTVLGTEAQFLDGANGKVVAEVVRKGTGKPLENDSQVMTPNDVKSVIDGWASDLHQSYLKLKKR